jgi:hypothetical protein
LSHIIIIRGKAQPEHEQGVYGGTEIEMQFEPGDHMTVDEQVTQYRKMLKLYLKARHVADPAEPDPGD